MPRPSHAPPIGSLIDHRPEEGIFHIHRDAYRDPAVHDLEIRHLFEGGWVFVGLASQTPAPHDFRMVHVGRQPVLIMRDAQGVVGAFHNTCRHKGAQVCAQAQGNRKAHRCPYHGWTYGSDGRNIAIRARGQGGYPASFDRDDHGLQRVARFGEYRGFLFASLRADVEPLESHLGDARVFLDLVVDQSPGGIELVPGRVQYTFAGNWKLQLENTLDAYHLTSVHPSYFNLLDQRAQAPQRTDVTAAIWQGDGGRQVEEAMGSFGFAQGHALVWTRTPVERHPLYAGREALAQRVGAVHADWMMRTRQFNLFPNLQLASNAALQMRVIRPLAFNLTEITSYCVAPVGEDAEARRRRIRQYEDFFNPSGLATPDDTVIFESSQRGFEAGEVMWQQGAARGSTAMRAGGDEHSAELGITPQSSMSGPFSMADETVCQAMYLAWQRRLEDGLVRDSGSGSAP
ncbi:MAG TPA: SRPBCC family protein [Burkholderiaceae bacterium]|jgi:phenylpropionate dioxygenase-like ring-hydroxylating dioxygenase large terminal subunit|nr:SRPBCC family protein [Burkholderiaceae bacterium]